MADNNPLRGAYLTCANEIRRLVVRSSVEYHQSNAYIAEILTFQKELFNEFYQSFITMKRQTSFLVVGISLSSKLLLLYFINCSII